MRCKKSGISYAAASTAALVATLFVISFVFSSQFSNMFTIQKAGSEEAGEAEERSRIRLTLIAIQEIGGGTYALVANDGSTPVTIDKVYTPGGVITLSTPITIQPGQKVNMMLNVPTDVASSGPLAVGLPDGGKVILKQKAGVELATVTTSANPTSFTRITTIFRTTTTTNTLTSGTTSTTTVTMPTTFTTTRTVPTTGTTTVTIPTTVTTTGTTTTTVTTTVSTVPTYHITVYTTSTQLTTVTNYIPTPHTFTAYERAFTQAWWWYQTCLSTYNYRLTTTVTLTPADRYTATTRTYTVTVTYRVTTTITTSINTQTNPPILYYITYVITTSPNVSTTTSTDHVYVLVYSPSYRTYVVTSPGSGYCSYATWTPVTTYVSTTNTATGTTWYVTVTTTTVR
jgi:hypothetical protein